MTERILIPSQFGGSWEQFVEEWCCGGALGYSPEQIRRGLSTLQRLWPEEVQRVLNEGYRGLAVAASNVERGLLLHACESADGFQRVLQRLKGGERSAYSELVLVAMLHRLEYAARLEPPLEGNVLDAACEIEGIPVYFEVVAPEPSEASVDDERLINELTAEVRRRVTRCRVEIEVRSSLDAAAIASIAGAIQTAEPSTWIVIEPLARARRIDAGQALPTAFDGDGAQIVVMEQTVQGEWTNVVVRWESPDARAKRVFNTEYHHFSPNVANVLVINVCAVSDGMKLWPREIARLLQPTRNRNVGAVLFFHQGLLGPPEAVRRRWGVLVNPHARLAVPERLLAGFESLDESAIYGLRRPERVVAGQRAGADEQRDGEAAGR